MQDVPQERSDAEAELSGKATPPVRFAGLVLDLDACTLVRQSGEAIPLTRGEFKLLRFFVSRPGRVLSRDALLDALANRRFEPFDRSVDVLIGKLRRKIEPDPKAPLLIITVPGEGYRFDGLAPALRGAQAAGGQLPSETPAGWLDRQADAKAAIDGLHKLVPNFTVQDWASMKWTDDPTFNAQYARIVEGLRKAGLPEGEAKKE
jgi:DNA-binding winged helix-turn-helix (wHTH) protein